MTGNPEWGPGVRKATTTPEAVEPTPRPTESDHVASVTHRCVGKTVLPSSNAQDLWINLGLAREGRTFPNDPVMVIE